MDRLISLFMTNARKGAALLDVERPDWFRLIDTEALNMEGAWSCILGQLYGDFETGMLSLNLRVWGMSIDSFNYGFNLHYDSPDYLNADGESWALLEIAWIQLINERLELASV